MTADRADRRARTSRQAGAALTLLLAGYFTLAVVAGAVNSPMTVLLPAGMHAPSWAANLAKAAGLDEVGRVQLTAVSWVVVLAVFGAFVVVFREAWAKRIGMSTVLVAAAISIAIAVAAPLLLSRDVYTYAAYGRITTLYHQNPYTATLSSFPTDPFAAVASRQWLHTHSHYGPVFTLLSAAVGRLFAGSVGATILAFKVLAGIAIAAATALAALIARRIRPDRAALTVVLVGLNPVIVIHTVGGAHVDALIAAPLLAATAIAVTRPPSSSARGVAVTVLLTLACLVKPVIAPALVLWLALYVRRTRALVVHAGAIVALAVASAAPFAAGWHTVRLFASLGGVEAWASPSHLVGRGAQAIVASFGGAPAGRDAARAVEAAFLLLFLVLLWRLARRTAQPADFFGVTLLLLALSLPYVLPWYAAWFAPFLGLLADRTFMLAGGLTSCVLGLTLIPADPFHGVTTPAVMNGVHYGAASVLLAVLGVVAARVIGYGPGSRQPRRLPLGFAEAS